MWLNMTIEEIEELLANEAEKERPDWEQAALTRAADIISHYRLVYTEDNGTT
jgi:hypothetical protein